MDNTKDIIIFDNYMFWFYIDEINNISKYIENNIYINQYIKTYSELQNPNNIISRIPINIQKTSKFINEYGMQELLKLFD